MPSQSCFNSSPYASGGGGVNFESQVGAAFVTLMLADGIVPILGVRGIKKIQFQAKDGHRMDDLIIYTGGDDFSGTRKVMVSVKSRVNVVDSDSEWKDVIKHAWADFQAEIFRHGMNCDTSDALLLVTRTLPSIDLDHTRVLFEWARNHQISSDFLALVEQAQVSSDEKRKKLTIIRKTLQEANDRIDIDDDLFHRFLRHFHWLSFDFDLRQGMDRALLHSIITKNTIVSPDDVWGRIVEEVQYAKQNAGVITRDSLSEDIQKHFRHPVILDNPHISVKESLPPIAVDLVSGSYAHTLGEAMLLGAWRENDDVDRTCIERFTGKAYEGWIAPLREVAARQDTPVRRRNDHWFMPDEMRRQAHWSNAVTQDKVDALSRAVRLIFGASENESFLRRDGVFNPPKGPWINISKELREGQCSGMALLANNTWPSVSRERVRNTVRTTIHAILPSNDVRDWSVIDRLLPTLSEAAPDVFLDRVELILDEPSETFRHLFSSTSNFFMGCSWCGLLWALEGLAWHPDHLQRATLALGRLAEVDAGEGNQGNRPYNSLVMIHMPWYPQSIAPPERRCAAMTALCKNYRTVAWKVLLKILPQHGQSSWPSRRPDWLNLDLPESGSTISVGEYNQVVEHLAELAVSMAESEPALVVDLLNDHYQYLHSNVKTRIKALLSSDEVKTEPIRSQLWRAVSHFIDLRNGSQVTHIEKSRLDLPEMERLAESLTPEEPFDKYQSLFSHNAVFSLMLRNLERSDAHLRIIEQRREAICVLATIYTTDRIYEFGMLVDAPYDVGYYYGEIAGNHADNVILAHLSDLESNKVKQLLHGYVYSRFNKAGWSWLDSVIRQAGKADQKVFLLSAAPFSRENLERIKSWPMEQEALYWRKANLYQIKDASLLSKVIERILACQCFSVATDLMLGIWYENMHSSTLSNIDQYVKVLLVAASSDNKRGLSQVCW